MYSCTVHQVSREQNRIVKNDIGFDTSSYAVMMPTKARTVCWFYSCSIHTKHPHPKHRILLFSFSLQPSFYVPRRTCKNYVVGRMALWTSRTEIVKYGTSRSNVPPIPIITSRAKRHGPSRPAYDLRKYHLQNAIHLTLTR